MLPVKTRLLWTLCGDLRRLMNSLGCFGDHCAGVEWQKQRGCTVERWPEMNVLPEFLLPSSLQHRSSPRPPHLSRWLCYLLSCSSPKYFDSFLSSPLFLTNSLADSISPSYIACPRSVHPRHLCYHQLQWYKPPPPFYWITNCTAYWLLPLSRHALWRARM